LLRAQLRSCLAWFLRPCRSNHHADRAQMIQHDRTRSNGRVRQAFSAFLAVELRALRRRPTPLFAVGSGPSVAAEPWPFLAAAPGAFLAAAPGAFLAAPPACENPRNRKRTNANHHVLSS